MHEAPAYSIHQRLQINIIAPCDQFQRIQISAELRRWLLKTIRHYSRLFATIRHYLHRSYYSLFAFPTVRTTRYLLFALFVLFAIRDYSPFAIRNSRLFAVRYSLFAIRDYSRLFAIRYSGFPDTPLLDNFQLHFRVLISFLLSSCCFVLPLKKKSKITLVSIK